jgi:hypothetical protein
MVHWWELVHCGQRKRISMVDSNYVIRYPLVHHHPLEALYDSVVDEQTTTEFHIGHLSSTQCWAVIKKQEHTLQLSG